MFEKAYLDIVVTESGIFKLVIPVYENAYSPIVWIVSPKSTVFKLVQL